MSVCTTSSNFFSMAVYLYLTIGPHYIYNLSICIICELKSAIVLRGSTVA